MIPKALQGRTDVWLGSGQGRHTAAVAEPGIPTGVTGLDDYLPWKGWPHGVTEILPDGEGIGELRLLLPALSALTRQGRWLTWVNPPHVPYAPALAAGNVDLSRMLLVQPDDPMEALWAATEALKSPLCGALLFWPKTVDDKAVRRLQRAAETGRSWAVLFRTTQAARHPSPAPLRLRLQGGDDRDSLALHILKCRGGWTGTLNLTLPAATAIR